MRFHLSIHVSLYTPVPVIFTLHMLNVLFLFEIIKEEDVGVAEVDPFLLHYERELSTDLQILLSREKPYTNHVACTWPRLENFQFSGLMFDSEKQTKTSSFQVQNTKSLDLSAVKKSKLVKIPDPPSQAFPLNSEKSLLESLFIKTQLYTTIPLANQVRVQYIQILNN